MTAAERVLDVARKEIGVTEYPPGSNKVKYNTWFYGREVSGASYPWCCSSLCYIFDRAGCGTLVKKTAGCTTLMNWFKAKGLLVPVKEARPSDIVFYQFDKDAYADHVGIIEKVNKNGVVAIEGNTSVTSDDNGGAVMRRNRKWNCIMAVARPDYASIKEMDEMTEKEIEALVEKKVNAAVKPLDEALCKAIKGLENKVYTNLAELPTWAQPVVDRLMAEGIITGDGTGKLHLTDRDLVTAAMVDKLRLAVIEKVHDLLLSGQRQ